MDHQTFAQLLGNYGEFIGSIAVLATLIYLTVQVRHSRSDSRAALLQHRSDAVRELWLTIARDKELAAALEKYLSHVVDEKRPVYKELEGTGLDPVEAIRVERWMAANFFHRQTLFNANLDASEQRKLDDQLISIYGTGGTNVAWFESTFPEGRKHGFDQDFVEHIRNLKAKSSM